MFLAPNAVVLSPKISPLTALLLLDGYDGGCMDGEIPSYLPGNY
jgi:hypothetical protein